VRRDHLFVLLSLLTVVACGGGGGGSPLAADSGAGSDAGADTDADADTDTQTDTFTYAECPGALIPSCGDAPYLEPTILEAREFGKGVRFVDAAPCAILAERDHGGHHDVMLLVYGCDTYDLWQTPSHVSVLPDTGLRPVALAGVEDGDYGSYRLVALLCDEALCTLFGSNAPYDDPLDLTPIEGSSFSASRRVRGIRMGEECGFMILGDGLWNEWSGWIVPPGSGPSLNDATCGWAVGDDGRFVSFGSEGWSELDSGVDVDLVAVFADGDRVHVGAADGSLGVGDQEGLVWANLFDEPIAHLCEGPFHMGPTSADFLGASASGCVVRPGPPFVADDYCVYSAMGEPPLRAFGWRCDMAYNVGFLGARALHGIEQCFHWE